MRYLKKRKFLCPSCGLEHDYDTDVCPKTDKHLSPVHKMGGLTLDSKYVIEDVIGSGGMGMVYQGLHKVIDRRVAVKFLSPETCSSTEVRQRFINEAKIAAALGHKNIVAVLDMGETPEDIPYIVMEYLEGENLGDVLQRETKLSVDRSIDITMQILEGLHAVHSQGIIHRDLKPENVFLAEQSGGDEIVKLLDFGISRLDQEKPGMSRLTEAGKVYGTPYYVSPEQAEGKLDADHRADIYSVGVLIYEMVTGQLPFKGRSYATLMVDIITRPPPDPREHLPELPVGLVAVINRALSKSPSLRFENAREMSRALEALTRRPSDPVPLPRGFVSSRPPPGQKDAEPSKPSRESLTGYRIVVPEIDTSKRDSEGPFARARRRRSNSPKAPGHVDIPSPPPSVEPGNLTDELARPLEPDEMMADAVTPAADLSTTRPIPRSDPMRDTPRVVPEDGAAMRDVTSDPARTEDSDPDGELGEMDEIDRGWDM